MRKAWVLTAGGLLIPALPKIVGASGLVIKRRGIAAGGGDITYVSPGVISDEPSSATHVHCGSMDLSVGQLVIVSADWMTTDVTPTCTDDASPPNTYTPVQKNWYTAANEGLAVFYSIIGTAKTGAIITVDYASTTVAYPTAIAARFTNIATSTPLDKYHEHEGYTTAPTVDSNGALAQVKELVVVCLRTSDGTVSTIDGAFLKAAPTDSKPSMIAYKIVNATDAVTYTGSSATTAWMAIMATFKGN